jgi:dephospho-CoA kinase
VTCTRVAAGTAVTFRVWVEADANVRLQRGMARDGESQRHLWLKWMNDEALFFERDGTRQAADIIVNGDPLAPHDPEMEVVLRD